MSLHEPNVNVPLARAELIKVAKRLRAAGEEHSATKISAIIDTHLDPTTANAEIDSNGHAAVVRKVAEIRERLRARRPRVSVAAPKS